MGRTRREEVRMWKSSPLFSVLYHPAYITVPCRVLFEGSLRVLFQRLKNLDRRAYSLTLSDHMKGFLRHCWLPFQFSSLAALSFYIEQCNSSDRDGNKKDIFCNWDQNKFSFIPWKMQLWGEKCVAVEKINRDGAVHSTWLGLRCKRYDNGKPRPMMTGIEFNLSALWHLSRYFFIIEVEFWWRQVQLLGISLGIWHFGNFDDLEFHLHDFAKYFLLVHTKRGIKLLVDWNNSLVLR